MIKNYFKLTWRNLQRNKLYSFINIAGLSLGLACAMLIILYIKDEVSYDRFHVNVNHIYRIVTRQFKPDGTIEHVEQNSGYLPGPKFSANIPEIQSFVRFQDGFVDIKNKTGVHSYEIFYTDSSFFSIFSFPLLSGNPNTCLLAPRSVVVSEEAAKNQFGTVQAVGKILMIKDGDQFLPYTVMAVTKRCPQNSTIKFDYLLPIRISAENQNDKMNWFSFFLNSFVVISPGANVKMVEDKMKKVYTNDAKDAIKEAAEKYDVKGTTDYLLQPFTDMHLNKDLPADNGLTDSSNPVYSYILSGISFFILLIACINFINLTVARSMKRAREIGIRKVVGGDRKQLIFQFLGESYLLCFIAFALAIVVVQVILPTFNNLSGKALSISYLLDAKLVGSYIFLFFITGLLAGFYPALVLSGYSPVQTLYNRFNLSGRNYLQKSLVVIQFALASFLIIATHTIFLQFNFLTSQKLGYDDSNLIMVNKSSLSRSEAGLFRQDLLKDPDINDIAFKNAGGWFTVAKINGDSILQFAYETVDETYLPLLKIPVLSGRNFSKDFPWDSSHSVLVNETFVKKGGWKNPVGQEINFWYKNNKKYTVIGVVKDFHFESLNQEIGPQVFTMNAANNYGVAYIKIRPNTSASSLQYIEKTFKKFFPVSPYTFHFKDQENLKNYESEAKWKQIMLFGAILTIFISSIGLFGLTVLSTEKRTKEIGIRKVLGASVTRIIGIISKDFIFLILIAMLASMPIALISANKWLQNYPYRVQLSWVMFGEVGLLVLFIAMATISVQAIKAASANPVDSLRSE